MKARATAVKNYMVKKGGLSEDKIKTDTGTNSSLEVKDERWMLK